MNNSGPKTSGRAYANRVLTQDGKDVCEYQASTPSHGRGLLELPRLAEYNDVTVVSAFGSPQIELASPLPMAGAR